MELKWTKFEDGIPKGDSAYITDFENTWISSRYVHNSMSWDGYYKGSHRQNYSWSEIPIPPVPIKKVEFHECTSKCKRYVCNGDVDQCFLIFTELEDDTYKKVFTCPFCGFRPGKGS